MERQPSIKVREQGGRAGSAEQGVSDATCGGAGDGNSRGSDARTGRVRWAPRAARCYAVRRVLSITCSVIAAAEACTPLTSAALGRVPNAGGVECDARAAARGGAAAERSGLGDERLRGHGKAKGHLQVHGLAAAQRRDAQAQGLGYPINPKP